MRNKNRKKTALFMVLFLMSIYPYSSKNRKQGLPSFRNGFVFPTTSFGYTVIDRKERGERYDYKTTIYEYAEIWQIFIE